MIRLFFVLFLVQNGFADSGLPTKGDQNAIEEQSEISPPTHHPKKEIKNQEENQNQVNPPPHAKKAQKSFSSKKSRHSKLSSKKPKWVLFEWLSENHISLEWAYGFLDQEDKNLYAPPLLKEKITKNFKNESLLYLNFHRDIIRFPYVLDWGLRGSIGLARSYDLKSDYFFPLSLSGIVSLRVWKHQPVVPFVEGGFSSWNINISSDFSDILPFWTVGAFVSLSLFKPSLRYTFANDYGVKDIGFVLEWRNHFSPFQKTERGPFLKTIHVGVYGHF